MSTKPNAALLVLLLLAASGAYLLVNDDGTMSVSPDNNTDDGEKIGDEWDVYYIGSESSLPECNTTTLGRLYYVESTGEFQTCTSSGWTAVTLTGIDGADGDVASALADFFSVFYIILSTTIASVSVRYITPMFMDKFTAKSSVTEPK